MDRSLQKGLWVGAVLAVALLAAAVLGRPDRKAAPPDTPAASSALPPTAGEPPAPRAGPRAPTEPLRAGETLQVLRAELSRAEPLELVLAVPAPPAQVESLPVSVFSEDGRSLELSGRVAAGDRERTVVAIDGAWLATPGRYVVQVKTVELSHFPIRRFAIEVR